MLIALEGIDGSGKGTQAASLVEKLKQHGLDVALFSFPRYEVTRFGAVIGEYLNGDFGEKIHPKLSSTIYAVDRFESCEDLKAQLSVRDVVVCDRYMPSNLAHQCAKLEPNSLGESDELADWIWDMEYNLFKIPKPDLVICLDLRVEFAALLIAKKAKRSYTDKKADIHEADLDYLSEVRKWYRKLGSSESLQHKDWQVVSVERNGHLRKVEDVFNNVWEVAHEACKDIIKPSSNDSK
jgi:dTMP kinase